MNFKCEDSLDRRIDILAVARGERPAEMLLKNVQLVNVCSGKLESTNLALQGGEIAGVGKGYVTGREVLDLEGCYVTPGLIDAHLHVESTLLLPPELARVIVPHGTTCVINDPHEIANVIGAEGVALMLTAADGLPCDFLSTVPSCVPATDMETAGAELNAEQVASLMEHPGVVGLGEMMNYPGIINGDKQALKKVAAAHRSGKIVDGHAPGLGGMALQAYVGAGISTDHECVTIEEAGEKIAAGMKVIIRHGSATSSLADLLPLVNKDNADAFMVGSDDREAGDLLRRGHLNDFLKIAVSLGADPILMVRAATLNAARHYRLYDRGAVAPGFRADLAVFRDLKEFRAEVVIKNGRVVAKSGKLVGPLPRFSPPQSVLQTVRLSGPLIADDFKLSFPPGRIAVIEVVPGQLITNKVFWEPEIGEGGTVLADPANGINKVAVVERHRASGRLGVALVRGIGLQRGALASSVGHDSHNILVVGVEEEAMAAAVNELAAKGGGFVAVDGEGRVKACLPLPLAGLMSLRSAVEVAAEMEKLLDAARNLGTALPQPFLTLSFLALPVIPSIRITDRGLFDVDEFKYL